MFKKLFMSNTKLLLLSARLVGSTTNNYGRLEMYDTSKHTWFAVCDSNVNVNNIMIICRQMGFVDGRYQQGSPLGPTTTDISIVSLDCSDTSECSFKTGSCFSGKYVAVYCSDTSITNECKSEIVDFYFLQFTSIRTIFISCYLIILILAAYLTCLNKG